MSCKVYLITCHFSLKHKHWCKHHLVPFIVFNPIFDGKQGENEDFSDITLGQKLSISLYFLNFVKTEKLRQNFLPLYIDSVYHFHAKKQFDLKKADINL